MEQVLLDQITALRAQLHACAEVSLRADYDELATPEGGAAHLCGHDGHAAALCGVALMLEGQSIGRSVFLLFQGAEETGAGAALCCELFDREKVGEIYGAPAAA